MVRYVNLSAQNHLFIVFGITFCSLGYATGEISNFVGIPSFSIALWVAMKTMHFHIAHTNFFRTPLLFRIQGVPMNNLAPMKNCPGGCKVT